MADGRAKPWLLYLAGTLFGLAAVGAAVSGVLFHAPMGYAGAVGFVAMAAMFVGAGRTRQKQARETLP